MTCEVKNDIRLKESTLTRVMLIAQTQNSDRNLPNTEQIRFNGMRKS